jgi:hypothetical protein
VPSACIASVDSVVDFGGWNCSLRGKGNFLYSTAIAKSTMDSSTKTMEDGIVDSPPNRNAQPVTISSPSPLRAKSTNPALMLGSFEDSRSFHKLYKLLPLPCPVEY